MNDKHLPDASAENPWLPLRQQRLARLKELGLVEA
ncbi:hypothetical protein, partial [Pseudomonas aeruginosa]